MCLQFYSIQLSKNGKSLIQIVQLFLLGDKIYFAGFLLELAFSVPALVL